MKVLGVGDDKYICEVSWDEMYYLTGNDDLEYEEEMISAGDEVDLTRVHKAAKWLRDLDQEHIERIIKELKQTLDGVEKVKDTAQKLNLFNKIKQEAV
jgi:hypothetical protein